ncbi:MAG: calcineurin-like phosphoesterase family protein [Planctomycetota bacterium]
MHALLPLVLLAATASAKDVAEGVVFEDLNGDGVRQASEPPLANMAVSNGEEVVLTNADGRYRLELDDHEAVFIIKPSGWMTPVDGDSLPRFAHMYEPTGSPEMEYAGEAPTGRFRGRSLDFPLVRSDEPNRFRVILFGDPQPYSIEEVNEFARDIIPEVIAENRTIGAAFGVTLGDLVGDDMTLYPALNQAVGTVGIPWYNVYGNHDMNFDAPDSGDPDFPFDRYADETFERVFGPPTYAFNYGPAHFIVLDNVVYDGLNDEGRGRYHAELTERQLSFIEASLEHVRQDRLVVLLMHIPMVEIRNLDALFALLKDRPNTVSMSAHWHRHSHVFFGSDQGWHGDEPHHHMVTVTAGGSWWQGAPDEYGIPHTMMRDGKPNGWMLLEIDGTSYELRYKAARRPWSDQLHIHAPSEIRVGEQLVVTANIYNATERDRAILSIENATFGRTTTIMERIEGVDPYWARLKRLESVRDQPGDPLNDLDATTNLWRATYPGGPGLEPGGYVLRVTTTDMFGNTHEARHVLRVVE